jgi:hypothetical protein
MERGLSEIKRQSSDGCLLCSLGELQEDDEWQGEDWD